MRQPHLVVSVLLVYVTFAAARARLCNVVDYGGVGDGKTNNTDAFLKTFQACADSASSTVYVPNGVFLTWPLTIQGEECSNVEFVIAGEIIAPEEPSTWPQNRTFFLFEGCDNLTIDGGYLGRVDGRGQNWWEIRQKDYSVEAPRLVNVGNSKNVCIRAISLCNSPMFHLVPYDSVNVLIEGVTITAPELSPNTDGIDPTNTQNVTISNCSISTGDDNIALKPGTRNVVIRNSYFGAGQGCSIGSINDTGVQNVHVYGCFFNGTRYGVRIKTWQGGSGLVANIVYEHLSMINMGMPLDINMYYCSHHATCKNSTKGVTINNITIEDVIAEQTTGVAGQFLCSDSVPCTGVHLKNVRIIASQGTQENRFSCWSAYGTADGVEPPSCLGKNPPLYSGPKVVKRL